MSKINNNINEMQSTDSRLRLISIVAGAITACIGGIILLGWALGFYNIFNFGKNWIPMADETAFLFLILGVVLVVDGKGGNNRKLRYYVIGTAIFIVIASLLTLIDFITNYNYNVSSWLIRKQEMIGGTIIGKASIITAVWFIFTSIALLLLKGKTTNISAYFGFFNLFVGYVIVHGYMYGVPLLYGGTLIPVSLPTAITFMISSAGLIAYSGQDAFPLKYFLGISTQARLMRNFLSVIFIIELVHDLIEVNFVSSHQTMNAFINSIVDIFAFIAFGYVIWLLSRSIGNSIDKNINERKRAEDALRESEEKLRTLIENMGEGVGIVDENEVFIFANPAAEVLFGVQQGELVGKNLSQFSALDKFDEIKNQTEIRKQGKISSYEYEIIRPDAERREIVVTASPLFDNHEQFVGTQAIFRDITERKQMEEELRESKEKFHSYIEHSPLGIFIVDETGHYHDCNRSAHELLGYTREELLKMSIPEISPVDDSEKNFQKFMILLNDGYIFTEINLLRKDKSIVPVLLEGVRLPNKLYMAFCTDITYRKLAEKLLKESESTLRGITDSAQDGIIMMNPNGEVSFWNPAAERIFGYSTNEVIGKNLLDLIIPGRYIESHLRGNSAFQQTGKGNVIGHTVELQALTKDGVEIEVELSLSSIHTDDQRNTVGIIRDITSRKEAERALENSNEELKHINAEKDKFFSIIAHDLKSPFSGFLGLTKIMAEQMQDLSMKELQQYSKSLNKSASGLYKLLENLLEWSRMQRGMINFNPENIPLFKMIEQNISVMTERAKQKEIKINSTVSEGINVFADVQMLNTVLRNLISNAVKFTNHGGTVLVGTEMIENDFVRFLIKDNGVGIDKVTLGNLFQIDKKVSRPGTDGETSTGLGLLLCKEFIEKNGGKIWVESEEDKGSTFYFTIPTRQKED